MIQPAKRVEKVEEYYFSKKLREIAEMNAKGADILNLGIGSPDRPPAKVVIDALQTEAEKENVHGYQSYQGLPELRNAFASWYQRYYKVTLNGATEILPLIGSKEGILHITMSFVNPGDKVLVPNPGYPTYSSVSQLAGAEILHYNLRHENHWYPDFEELEAMDLTGVKIMWVNYPNMPTGTPATMELFEKLVAFGKKHGILICNDNPYSFVLNHEQLSILQIEGAKEVCIELNSLSKSHNMAGWRLGMIAGKPEFIQYILRFKSNMDSGTFRPMQVAAVKALSLGDEWYTEMNETYRKRRELVYDILDMLGCTYDKDQRGMFMWAKIPANTTAQQLADKILYEAKVFITPGFIFGSNGEGFIRISLCSNEEVLSKANQRIKEAL